MYKKILCMLFVLSAVLMLTSCLFDDEEEEWSAAKVCPGMGTNAYGMPNRGTFTDERDGRVYKYTTIGNQVWMAENSGYKTEGSICYYEENICSSSGLKYNLSAAENAFPTGWHIPSLDEWKVLYGNVGGENVAGKRLKSPGGWLKLNPDDNSTGTDDCGFCILPYRVTKKQDGLETEFLTTTRGRGDLIFTATFL